MSRTPGGFYLLAFCSGAFTLGMVAALLALDPSPFDQEWRLLARGVVTLLAALSAITTEALWNARPWAARASTALAAAFGAGLLAVLGDASSDDLSFVFGVMFGAAIPIIPALLYIHARTRQLWPQPGARVVVPPHPAPTSARRP